MAKKSETLKLRIENRKHHRCIPVSEILAISSECSGPIRNISIAGVALVCHSDNKPTGKNFNLSLIPSSSELMPQDLPCTAVWDMEIPRGNDNQAETGYLCGLKFGELGEEQKAELLTLIKVFTDFCKP